jgi:hypothetical protein
MLDDRAIGVLLKTALAASVIGTDTENLNRDWAYAQSKIVELKEENSRLEDEKSRAIEEHKKHTFVALFEKIQEIETDTDDFLKDIVNLWIQFQDRKENESAMNTIFKKITFLMFHVVETNYQKILTHACVNALRSCISQMRENLSIENGISNVTAQQITERSDFVNEMIRCNRYSAGGDTGKEWKTIQENENPEIFLNVSQTRTKYVSFFSFLERKMNALGVGDSWNSMNKTEWNRQYENTETEVIEMAEYLKECVQKWGTSLEYDSGFIHKQLQEFSDRLERVLGNRANEHPIYVQVVNLFDDALKEIHGNKSKYAGYTDVEEVTKQIERLLEKIEDGGVFVLYSLDEKLREYDEKIESELLRQESFAVSRAEREKRIMENMHAIDIQNGRIAIFQKKGKNARVVAYEVVFGE